MGTERVLGVPTLGHPEDVPARSWLSTLPTHLPGEGPRRALTRSEHTAAPPAAGPPAESVQGSMLRAPPSLGCTELLGSRLR